MTNMEIGSEFHKTQTERGVGFLPKVAGELVFSGRTAIETVLMELPSVKKAALPSYCCDSMIEPFRRANVTVEFYAVNYNDGLEIDPIISEDTDLILWCNYFGFCTPMPDFSSFKSRGGVIVEDVTHSLLSDTFCNQQSDYLVASVRKWFPVNSGGYCASVNGNLSFAPKKLPPTEFVELKARAMALKAEYLEDFGEQKKERFLSMFGSSNHWLAENYSSLAIDLQSKEVLERVDLEEHRKVRRRNARVLYEGLDDKATFLFPKEKIDCPLFVPIVSSRRDELRKILVENEIYCPIHWPRPSGCCSNLYDVELSLICDQRYGEEDMNRIVSVLRDYFKANV